MMKDLLKDLLRVPAQGLSGQGSNPYSLPHCNQTAAVVVSLILSSVAKQ